MTRLAEVLGSLSLATDVAAGLPPETALRTAVCAVRVGRAAGVQGFELQDAFYVGLLRFIGCTAYSYELARGAGGDDLAVSGAAIMADQARPLDVLKRVWTGTPRGRRARVIVGLLSDPRGGQKNAASHCDLAATLASRLGMSPGVVLALGQAYERWDGRGPNGVRGDAIDRKARVLHVAWRLAAHYAIEGANGALAVIAERRGGEFDPAMCRVVDELGEDVFRGGELWDEMLASEPAPHFAVSDLRRVATAFAHFVDVKSPYTLGHSFGVGALLARAATDDRETLELAGLLHDLGRVAVPNGIWDKRGVLTNAEWARVHAHPYETDRICQRAALLRPLAKLAARHHERLDETGYPARVGALTPAERLVAAADVYHALGEARPHRPAHDRNEAARVLRDEATRGRLCPKAVDAILAAAGHTRDKPPLPSGLSEREVEVLACVARGLGNKEIASALHISPKTVQRHLENIFDKTKIRSRAGAAVFAVEHGLVDRDRA